ncbi:lipid-A-disaccharide synthase [Amantichitinum ursilacus]|uniref:Lipid-A-disaccharide synthase n=1 Tax=Amantichitinum ursilacus TaxID=857265 RepID=A0A0N1JTV3_9NEIS|nr:lipid-A-disaccharide synthase [Amantichitinum ursilacus]KPC55224.1 Lipid-A-disaccharide synthase [Amantichitinum ursilacus]
MIDRLFPQAGGHPRIAIVAGEASGDLLGAALIEALRQRLPNAIYSGIAGPRMKAEGAHSVVPMEKLAVRGYAEVIKHLPELLRIRRELKDAILREKPDLVIGIDAPDFNLGLEAACKAAGIPVVHYVSPSIWAWRSERLKKIGQSVSHVLLLFPFEEALYRQAGIPATYVGHPLADQFPLQPDQPALRETLGVPVASTVFAMLPGSRQSELALHAALFVETARKLFERYPSAVFLVPFITRETRDMFETEMWKQGAQELPFRLMFGHAHEAMQASDAIVVASGTAALEAMLAKRPTVVTYRLTNFTYRMVRKKIKTPYISLPNALAARFVVPELLQYEATADNIVQAVSNMIDDKRFAAQINACFTEFHEQLRCGAADRAADAVVKVLGKGRAG